LRRVLVALFLVGCGSTAMDADAGRDAEMQITGASFIRGPMPQGGDGPAVAALVLQTAEVHPGTDDKPFGGALERGATAALLGLSGDRGYWIVRAGPPDIATPTLPSFHVLLSFADSLPQGSHDMLIHAVDGSGRIGPRMVRPLSSRTLPDASDGAELVVSLTWDTEADLDLHVVDPAGVEVWKGNINSYARPAPGEPIDPEGWKKGGVLDFDANAACVVDGRRRENVYWKLAPPPGQYRVRVDTFSLCGRPAAHWVARATLRGNEIAVASGVGTVMDTRYPHEVGSGALALTFDVP
jgi:hypothetical protein